MQVVTVDMENHIPAWLTDHALESALRKLAKDVPVVLARRNDGDVQVIPEGHLDAEVIEALLKWAAHPVPALENPATQVAAWLRVLDAPPYFYGVSYERLAQCIEGGLDPRSSIMQECAPETIVDGRLVTCPPPASR